MENYQYSNKIRTLIWEDTSYEDAQALKEDAEAKLEDLSIPKRSYSAEIRDLARLSKTYSILDYSLGDTVLLTDEPAGINEKQRIVKITEYPDAPEKNTIELSNTVLSWEELQDRMDAAAAAWEDISNADGSVNGVYVHGVLVGDVVGITAEINDVIDDSMTIQGIQNNISVIQGDVSQAQTDISTVADSIAAVAVRVGNVETTYLRATDAAMTYATITNLNATNAAVESIQGDYASFKSVTADELAAHSAVINNLETTYLKTTLANIDTANVNTAKVNDLYAATGLIKHVTISEGHVTDFLDAVQVDAASITAGTLIADRILLRGSTSGVLYALNNSGELESEQVDTLDGYVLTDRTINADKIVAHSITANELTVENITGVNGWVNLAQGTFNYGNKLIWDGSALTVDGTISAGAGSNIGPWTVTETSIYKTNATWGNSTAGAAYFGDNGISITDKFKVSAAGALTAVSGKIGGWYLAATRIGSSSDFTLGSGGAKFEIINETNKPFLVAQNSNSKTVFSLERTGAITILDEGPQQSQSMSEWANFKIARHGSQTSKYLVATSSNVYIADGSALASLSAGYLSLQNAISNTNYYAEFGAGVTAIETNGRIISSSSVRVQTSSATEAYFHAINDDRKGFFGVSSGSNLGIYDGTNGSWVMYSDTDQVVRIPHLLFCQTYSNANRVPIGSDTPNKYRVAQLASYTTSINIWAQWGVEGASYTARSLSVPSSDIRLKENVKMSQVNALEMINKIQMRAFDWKDGSGHWDVGFVADELEKIDPKLSIGGGKDEDGNPMYKSVNDFYLLGYAVKAIQELSAENNRLNEQIQEIRRALA